MGMALAISAFKFINTIFNFKLCPQIFLNLYYWFFKLEKPNRHGAHDKGKKCRWYP